MFKAVVGCSEDIDSDDAVTKVIESCDEQLEGGIPVAGLVFCGTEFDHSAVLKKIMGHYPGLHLIGCTTDGEMTSCGGFTEDAITLTLFCTDKVDIAAGYGEGASEDPHRAAKQAIKMASSKLSGEPRLVIALPDGLTTSAYEVLDGFNNILGAEIPVIGGMSADRVAGSKISYSTYQFFGEKVLTDSVPTLLFSGPLIYSLGVESGWSPIGEKMTVTKVDNNVLHCLNDRPAFEIYSHYLGDVLKENISGLGSYPLAVYEQGLDRFYLRVAKTADPETGTITFLGEVPEGAEVQITQAIRDQVLGGVNKSVETAIAGYSGQAPSIALMFSCTGRKLTLGTKTREEIARASASFDQPLPMSGFYTFGEIGPASNHTRARYHNTTFVSLLMGDG